MKREDIEFAAYSATRRNDVEGLKRLFAGSEGADPSIRPYGRSLLLHAALQGAHDVATFLIENGFDVNEADQKGYTPLHGAAEMGDTAMANLLLTRGAKPNVTDMDGSTPLSKAIYVSRGDLSLIRALVAGGADPEFVFCPGMDARVMARQFGKQWIVDCFNSLKKSS